MLTVGSLFSGIGGLELGLERAGMRTVWQVEQDEYCRSVLAKHWPDALRFEDVRDVGAHNLPRVDVVCGGFPCQDISDAGKRAGIGGERSGLWSEYARIIRELRPRYVVVENVAALRIRGLDVVLGDLANLGYDAEWSVLSACAVGAPHTRERLFILAHRDGIGGTGLVEAVDSGTAGSWGPRGAAHLQPVLDRPFGDGRGWPQPLIRRMDDGVPHRVDRLRALGNAVVPQVAEYIGRAIVAHHQHARRAT